MSFFSRLKSLIKKEPEEQIAGYSVTELKTIFTSSFTNINSRLPEYPKSTSLEGLGIPAFYSSFLIDNKDIQIFLALTESNFKYKSEKIFNGLPAKQYVSEEIKEQLVFFTSTREFNSTTVRMVTNSVDFMNIISREKLVVPPPWIAFEGYNPSWWGGDMQGAQGYYNDNYFLPFFTQLSDLEKKEYYARFEAADEWIESLNVMYGDE
ncbi:hypothetical protein [Pseudomonas sp.]|uniref:hypothetical protein n=1 Tax=Pseudomonas sp. TaxID=306 RepID=UPI003F3CDD39